MLVSSEAPWRTSHVMFFDSANVNFVYSNGCSREQSDLNEATCELVILPEQPRVQSHRAKPTCFHVCSLQLTRQRLNQDKTQ